MQSQKVGKRYVYTNQKGGVGKTTESLNFATAGTLTGKRVLAVDVDHAQGNLTYALGYQPAQVEKHLYAVMRGEVAIHEAILPTYYDPSTGIFFDPHDERQLSRLGLSSLRDAKRGPDLLPMNPLACDGVEPELLKMGNWGTLLTESLNEVQDQYDEMHLDTNPDIRSVFAKSAVYAATDVIIAAAPENWPVQGMILLAKFLMEAREVNEHFHVTGVVFTRVRYANHNETMTLAREQVIPSINAMLQKAVTDAQREHKPRRVRQLTGLSFSCFNNTISESKEYSLQSLNRSTVMTARRLRKGEIAPVLEQWSCYIELLEKSGGEGIPAATAQYNALVDSYEIARS